MNNSNVENNKVDCKDRNSNSNMDSSTKKINITFLDYQYLENIIYTLISKDTDYFFHTSTNKEGKSTPYSVGINLNKVLNKIKLKEYSSIHEVRIDLIIIYRLAQKNNKSNSEIYLAAVKFETSVKMLFDVYFSKNTMFNETAALNTFNMYKNKYELKIKKEVKDEEQEEEEEEDDEEDEDSDDEDSNDEEDDEDDGDDEDDEGNNDNDNEDTTNDKDTKGNKNRKQFKDNKGNKNTKDSKYSKDTKGNKHNKLNENNANNEEIISKKKILMIKIYKRLININGVSIPTRDKVIGINTLNQLYSFYYKSLIYYRHLKKEGEPHSIFVKLEKLKLEQLENLTSKVEFIC